MKYIAYIFLLSVLVQGCKNSTTKLEHPNAGVVTYAVEYPKEIKNSPTGSLMPSELTFSFKNDRIHHNFKGSFNIFSLDFYSPSSKDSCTTLFRFMDNNLVHKGSVQSNFFFFNNPVTPSISFVNEDTKKIAGISCSKALVKYGDKKAFEVYYANSINLDNPNRHTPFSDIPGLLMEFHINFNGVRFHFKAKDIDYTSPEDSIFEIPNGAKQTAEKEIEGLILTMINNFQ